MGLALAPKSLDQLNFLGRKVQTIVFRHRLIFLFNAARLLPVNIAKKSAPVATRHQRS